jgi:hypothetical protein
LDPLIRFKEAHVKGIIPDDVYDLVLKLDLKKHM